VLRVFAQATYGCNDHVLAAALRQAGRVLAALDAVQWRLLDSVTRFVSRQDGVGERAQRLVTELATTAAATQFERSLEPVLSTLNARAVTLVEEAARLSAVAPPAQGQLTPGQISLTDLGQPPVPSASPQSVVTPPLTATANGRRRVRAGAVEAHLSALLGEVGEEIAAFRAAHPGVEIEIEIAWHAVQPGNEGAQT
jgi:hypothetical protein